jgi:uncharacterized protein (DUF1810 family)
MTNRPNPFDLERFVAAQDGCYETVIAELRRGAKRTHWMWFVFPQISGLGHSATATRYAIGSRVEAEAYLTHPILGPRLDECVAIIDALTAPRAVDVFGGIDATKLRSSLTLFIACGAGARFASVLDRWFEGRMDEETLRRLR